MNIYSIYIYKTCFCKSKIQHQKINLKNEKKEIHLKIWKYMRENLKKGIFLIWKKKSEKEINFILFGLPIHKLINLRFIHFPLRVTFLKGWVHLKSQGNL
jgi:hypothetical protein